MTRPSRRSERQEPEDVSRETSTPSYRPPSAPAGLGTGGRKLWREIVKVHELDAAQQVQLLEACRMKDRLDRMDAVLRGDVDYWMTLDADRFDNVEVSVSPLVDKANQTANMLKQLLAALRLPDAAGKRPQQRGGARGAYVSGGADGGTDKPGAGGGTTLGNLRGITGGRSA